MMIWGVIKNQHHFLVRVLRVERREQSIVHPVHEVAAVHVLMIVSFLDRTEENPFGSFTWFDNFRVIRSSLRSRVEQQTIFRDRVNDDQSQSFPSTSSYSILSGKGPCVAGSVTLVAVRFVHVHHDVSSVLLEFESFGVRKQILSDA